MIPKTIKVSEFRKHLSQHLEGATTEPIVVQDAHGQYVVLTIDAYNRLSFFEDLYKEEDPEGNYKKSFLKQMKTILKKKDDIEPKIHSLKDLL